MTSLTILHMNKKHLNLALVALSLGALFLGACEDRPGAKTCLGAECFNSPSGQGGTQQGANQGGNTQGQSEQAVPPGVWEPSPWVGGDPPKLSTQQNPEAKVIFSVPSEWVYDWESSQRAFLFKPAQENKIPYVMVEVWGWPTSKQPYSAKQAAEEDFANALVVAGGDWKDLVKMTEDTVGNHKVWVITSPSSALGSVTYMSSIFFEKDGNVYDVEIGDVFQTQKDAIQKIIETVHLK